MDIFHQEIYIKTMERAIDGNLTKFAKKTGLSGGNLSKIRKGQIAKPETLMQIANASEGRVSYLELMDAAGYLPKELYRYRDPALTPTTNKVLEVPVVRELDGTKESIKNKCGLEKICYYADAFPPGDYIFFEVQDEAFCPRLNPDDRVLVDLKKKPVDNDAVLFRLNGDTTMFRRLRKVGKRYICYGDNMAHFPVVEVNAADVEIFGVAIRAYVKI